MALLAVVEVTDVDAEVVAAAAVVDAAVVAADACVCE
jgi:hypothetical protein